MGQRYRLEVIAIGTGTELDETLGAVEGSAELVAALAPTVIETALADETGESVTVEQVAATGAADAEPAKPKRTRRTKAQIAADNAKAAEQPTSPLPAGVESPLAEPLPRAESAPAASSEPAPSAAAPTTEPPASGETKPPYDPFA